MSKRGRASDGRFASGGSQTGGTGDVKPQILSLSSGNAPVLDVYSVETFRLPVSRFGGARNVTTIVEFLKVWWFPNVKDGVDASVVNFAYLTTATAHVTGDVSTAFTFTEDLEDGRTFAPVITTSQLSGATGASTVQFPQTVDLTDNNGNGILVATDSIVVVGGQNGGSILGGAICKILYRLVNVGIEEYVGIVQSQQGG